MVEEADPGEHPEEPSDVVSSVLVNTLEWEI